MLVHLLKMATVYGRGATKWNGEILTSLFICWSYNHGQCNTEQEQYNYKLLFSATTIFRFPATLKLKATSVQSDSYSGIYLQYHTPFP